MRSMMFVPGHDERKLAKATDSGADALILDLEDSVAPAAKSLARQRVCEYLRAPRRTRAFVRINALGDDAAAEDLAAVIAAAPDGIMLPKCCAPDEVRVLDQVLGVLEVREGVPRGHIAILPIAVELAAAAFTLGGYRGVSPRLCGLMWGVEDLATDLASAVRDEGGRYLPAIELGRSLCLYAAAAAGVPAIDAVYTDFRDDVGLATDCAAAQRAGFAAKAAIHPQQIPVINQAFTPSADAVREAQRIVEAFRAAPAAGAIAIDGRMRDRPHLRAAEMILARARGAG